MSSTARIGYPTKAKIAQAVQAAKSCGIDVCGFEVTPEGVIRIMEARSQTVPANDFERWQDRL